MRNAWIWIVIIVVIIVGGFIWWQSMQSSSAPTDQIAPADTATQVSTTDTKTTDTSSTTQTTSSTSNTRSATPVTVIYDGQNFSPSTVTVKQGDVVNFVDSGGTMWVASSPHPAHTGYDGTSRGTHCAPGYTGATPFDECSSGTSYSFTFTKVGTWSYHDHMNPSAFGKVVVTQ